MRSVALHGSVEYKHTKRTNLQLSSFLSFLHAVMFKDFKQSELVFGTQVALLAVDEYMRDCVLCTCVKVYKVGHKKCHLNFVKYQPIFNF